MSDAVAPDSTARALGVVLAVAFACALLVSAATVGLRPLQQAAQEQNLQLQSLLTTMKDIGYDRPAAALEARVIELDSGRYDDSIDAAEFDAERAAADPGLGIDIPAGLDLARIKRRARHAVVYLLRDADGAIDLIALPVYGKGYQSTLRAWLLLDGDGRRVRALRVYDHGETPGVGTRVEDPQWQAQWRGLPAYDDQGELRIGVDYRSTGGEYAEHQVDGISGATRTARGVDGMVRYWMGDSGFGPFLRRIREEGG